MKDNPETGESVPNLLDRDQKYVDENVSIIPSTAISNCKGNNSILVWGKH